MRNKLLLTFAKFLKFSRNKDKARLRAKSVFLAPSLLPAGAKLSFHDFAEAVSYNNAFAPRMNGGADEDRRSQSGVNLQRGAGSISPP